VLSTETDANKIARAKVKIILSVEESLCGKCMSNGKGRVGQSNVGIRRQRLYPRKVELLRKITTTKLEGCKSMKKYVNEIMSAASAHRYKI